MRTTHRQLIHRVLVLAVGICILTAACGKDDTKTASAKANNASTTSGAAAESPYCDTAREWSIHELVPADDSDPAAFKTYWGEYIAFNHKARDLAPAELSDEWTLSSNAIDAMVTPVLEKYGFDVKRIEAEGTEAEKSLTDPPPDVQKAQSAIHRYESDVCASEQPPAAEVDFSKEKKAAAYCDAVEADNQMVGEVNGAGARPDDVRKLATSKDFRDALERERDTAPPVIKADVEAVSTFVKDKQLPLMARYGYDIRKILLEGPQADRETLQRTAPEVRDHYARAAAYEEQVCGQ